VILAYAEGYKPGGSGSCTPNSGVAATACIEIQDYPGGDAVNKDKAAILINAGEHDWDNDADSDFSNDLWDLFDNRNGDLDYQFTWRWPGDPNNATPRKVPPGNDNLIILEES
jgi:hypothetical protein